MEYHSEYNYVSAHLAWVNKNKNFVPQSYTPITVFGFPAVSYYDMLREMYDSSKFGTAEGKNKLAFIYYRDDLQWVKDQLVIQKSLNGISQRQWFVTIGFDHGLFQPGRALEWIRNLLAQSCFRSGTFAVLEYHRENGDHPHVHIKVISDECKSSLIRHIWRARDRRLLITRQNFIDAKPYLPAHDNYLDGKKSELKMPYVEKDREWRLINGIPEKVFKE